MSGKQIAEINPEVLDGPSLPVAIQAEINQQIATARRYPRNVKEVAQEIFDMATLSEEVAAEMSYLLTRKDKTGKIVRIEGPSIRFAEIIAQAYGNYRAVARITEIDTRSGFIKAEGVFMDLQKNGGTIRESTRPIKTRTGHIYSQDMIATTGNAACSIAIRNAILAGVPKAIWGRAHEASQKLLRGNEGERVARIDAMEKAFRTGFNVSADRILAKVGIKDLHDITLDQLADLKMIYATLQNGEARVEDQFPTGEPEHEVIANPFDDGTAKAETAKKKKPKDEPKADAEKLGDNPL